MKIKKMLIGVLSAVILFTNLNISYADQSNDFLNNAQLLEISEWKEYEESEAVLRINSNERSNDISISETKNQVGENVVLYNNGNPIETNIFERKDGNELFAITINNIGQIEQRTYYFYNLDSIDINILLENIETQEEINNKNNVKSSRNSIKNYKWDFYATGKDGVKRQQGSLATSVSFTRRSSNTTIGNVKGSVWDIDSSSQLLSRSNGFLENHITRLDVNQPNQTLYSWGPYDSGKSTATVSLTGLLDVKSWSFPLNGFSVTDLSNKGSKYGRWQYKAHLTSSPTTMNTRPGMRVTNTKGSLITKLSQTAKIATPYAISDHSTGVISIYTTDR